MVVEEEEEDLRLLASVQLRLYPPIYGNQHRTAFTATSRSSTFLHCAGLDFQPRVGILSRRVLLHS